MCLGILSLTELRYLRCTLSDTKSYVFLHYFSAWSVFLRFGQATMTITTPRRGSAINNGPPIRLDRDDSTVLRSPNARAARFAMTSSAFADEAPPLPTARLRQSYLSNEPPQVGLPTHFSVSTNGQSMPLIGSLDRYPSRGMLTPRKAWHSSLAVRAALTLSVFLILTFAVVHSVRSGVPFGVSSNMAACEPSYDTLMPPLRRLKSAGSQHIEHEDVMGALGELRPRIAMVTMADSRKMPMPRKLSYMTGIEEGTEVDILQVFHTLRGLNCGYVHFHPLSCCHPMIAPLCIQWCSHNCFPPFTCRGMGIATSPAVPEPTYALHAHAHVCAGRLEESQGVRRPTWVHSGEWHGPCRR